MYSLLADSSISKDNPFSDSISIWAFFKYPSFFTCFVAKEELEVEAIKLDGYKVDKIIVANKNGETLNNDDWSYDEDGKIKVKIEKAEETIKTNEFLITYVFSGDKEIEKPFKINNKINGSVFMFGTDEKSDYELIAEYELNESLGSIISIESEAQETLELGNILNWFCCFYCCFIYIYIYWVIIFWYCRN